MPGHGLYLPGVDNSFVVIIHELDPFVMDTTAKGAERVVTGHWYLPALRCNGTLAYGGLRMLIG